MYQIKISIKLKYFHELVDSWLLRGKLGFSKFADSIELEDWWSLEESFEQISKVYINSKSNEDVIIQF